MDIISQLSPGIEVEYNPDCSIKLHQRKYIEKIVERFLPNGPLEKCQRNSLPHSEEFLQRVATTHCRAIPLTTPSW